MSSIITAKIVDENKMLAFLPRKLPRHFSQFESLVYYIASKAIKKHTGGNWEFIELSNQGFYLRPLLGGSKVEVQIENNAYNGTVTEDAAGIIVTILSVTLMRHKSPRVKSLYNYQKALIEYVNFHDEKNEILAAVTKQK